MNKRIKELAEQAGLNMWVNGNNEVEFSENEKKFAELIVRECMKVASPNYMSTSEDSVYYVEQAIDRIKQHFGVEK
jgi:ketopantoate reductase